MTNTLSDTNETRLLIIETCNWLNASGLNQGTSGNVSVRIPEGILVTPSGVPYSKMRPDMLQIVPATGEPEPSGALGPTTEWRFHQAVLAARPDMAVVLHAHPAHATALAVQRKALPACHYMIAAFGGSDVPLVDYALYGSPELSQMVAVAMSDRSACLMANHGVVVAGETIERATWRLEELETLARIYLLSQTAGTPVILSAEEMAEVIEAFGNYGPKTLD